MTEKHRRGDIRLRSNIVLSGNQRELAAAWRLVPGEVVECYRPHILSMRGADKRQRDENGYYVPCSLCQRLAHKIGLEGCDEPHCPMSRPSEASVAAARARHQEALELIRAEREHLDEETPGTEDEDLGPVIDPEAAVARFLALEAMTDAPYREQGRGQTRLADA